MQFISGEDRTWQPASHEDPRQPGVWKRVLAVRDDLQPGRIQMVNWSRLPAGASFQPHYHEDMQEIFVVVSGHATMTVNGHNQPLATGDMIVVDPMEVHQMHNPTEFDVVYVVFGVSSEAGGQTVVVDRQES